MFNRIDLVFACQPLSKEVMRKVVDREIVLLKRREGLFHRKLTIQLTEALHDYLCTLGYDARYGARALQRTLREELIIPLAYELNQYGPDDRLQIKVDYIDQKVNISIKSDPLQFELLMEELAQNEYMDYVSELRYQMARMCEGQFYVHLLSDMDILKREIKQMKQAFWADAQRSNTYTNSMAMQQRVEAHKERIEVLEMEMALASMGWHGINTKLYEDIKAWDKEYFNIKLDLYRLLDSDADRISVGIYVDPKNGGDVKRLLDLYLPTCQEKEFDCIVQTVWYRDTIYNATEDLMAIEGEFSTEELADMRILEVIEKVDEPKRFLLRRSKKEYYKKYYELGEHKKSMRPDEKEDKLVGIELQIKGPGANLYFAHETMMHAFEYEENKFENFYLQTFDGVANTPKDIFRKDFLQLQRKPRRKYTLRHIQDSELDFPKHEIEPAKYAEGMLKIWNRLFEAHLNELVK